MQQNRDDYEPIIADRRSREPEREDAQPLWRMVLAIVCGLAAMGLFAWWFMGKSSSDVTSAIAPSETSTPQNVPEENVEQAPTPPARDIETSADIPQSPTSSTPTPEPASEAEQTASPKPIPEVAPEEPAPAPAQPAPVSVRFGSPDAQVRFELRGRNDSTASVTSKAGDVLSIAPGTYRVVASGPQLETFEQEVKFAGERPYEYTVELCAQRKSERESLAGRVVEERACSSTPECESMFVVLSEHAEQLVRNRSLRAQQCAKWRANAAPEGKWTLDVDCGGPTLATTCRIEIADGACTFVEPRRSARGTICPRVQFR